MLLLLFLILMMVPSFVMLNLAVDDSSSASLLHPSSGTPQGWHVAIHWALVCVTAMILGGSALVLAVVVLLVF